jgi:hypothetical protein
MCGASAPVLNGELREASTEAVPFKRHAPLHQKKNTHAVRMGVSSILLKKG